MNKIQIINFTSIPNELTFQRVKETYDVALYSNFEDAREASEFNLSQATVIICNSFDDLKTKKDFNSQFKNRPLFIWSDQVSFSDALEFNVDGIFHRNSTPQELLWKISVPMKKYSVDKIESAYTWQNLSLEFLTSTATFKNANLNLTSIEFKILNYLVRNKENISDREKIKSFVWPNEMVTEKTLNTHLTNLRNKLKSTTLLVKSIRGQGIQIIDQAPQAALELE
ncbi:MAG: winged-helix domain-containing protein [Oligoflexia bacterium]|nr:winged-helix domain-containing protein [Oligoflexia bacterium]